MIMNLAIWLLSSWNYIVVQWLRHSGRSRNTILFWFICLWAILFSTPPCFNTGHRQLNLIDDKSTLVQVMACCLRAPSHLNIISRLNIIKMLFPGMEIFMMKITRPWDCLIFIMGIPTLVRWHLYIEKAPKCHCVNPWDAEFILRNI